MSDLKYWFQSISTSSTSKMSLVFGGILWEMVKENLKSASPPITKPELNIKVVKSDYTCGGGRIKSARVSQRLYQ